MIDLASTANEPIFISDPRDPYLRALYDYWNTVRGDRPMPKRADIDPTAIPKLLPHIMMYNVLPDGGGCNIRLVGEEVVDFVGRNATGQPAGSALPPHAAEILNKILNEVAAKRMPKFRAGKAHWQPDKNYREFEACFLPLASNGETVDITLAGLGSQACERLRLDAEKSGSLCSG